MQLGKSLMGAVVGAAVGIGLLVLFQLVFHLDGYWLAILVALATGLGVRRMASVKGNPSYLRGALTAILAIVAFVGGQYVVAQVAVRGQPARPTLAGKSTIEPSAETPANETAGAPNDAPPAADSDRGVAAGGDGGIALPGPRPAKNPVWDYVWLAVAALVGYELGRGSVAAPVATEAAGG